MNSNSPQCPGRQLCVREGLIEIGRFVGTDLPLQRALDHPNSSAQPLGDCISQLAKDYVRGRRTPQWKEVIRQCLSEICLSLSMWMNCSKNARWWQGASSLNLPMLAGEARARRVPSSFKTAVCERD